MNESPRCPFRDAVRLIPLLLALATNACFSITTETSRVNFQGMPEPPVSAPAEEVDIAPKGATELGKVSTQCRADVGSNNIGPIVVIHTNDQPCDPRSLRSYLAQTAASFGGTHLVHANCDTSVSSASATYDCRATVVRAASKDGAASP